VYSHLVYDIVPGARSTLHRPDILLVEGLNVLQPAPSGSALAVSDFIDFSVYVDAATADIRRWYVERFLRLRETAFRDPDSYFHRSGRWTRPRRSSGADDLGEINGRTWSATSSRPGVGRAWCCARGPATT
jgi:type I pantothenate kinase